MVAESDDGLLLATVQVYSPPVVTVRVWVYWAVSGSSNIVSAPSVTGVESLVQDTVVAIPPVEIQVRVIVIESTVSVGSPNIEISPRKGLIPFIIITLLTWNCNFKVHTLALYSITLNSTTEEACANIVQGHKNFKGGA